MRYPALRNAFVTSSFSDEGHGGRRRERGDRQYPDEYLYEVLGLNEYLQREFRRDRRSIIGLALALVILFGAVGFLGRERQVDPDISGPKSVASCTPLSGAGYCPRGIAPLDDFGIQV